MLLCTLALVTLMFAQEPGIVEKDAFFFNHGGIAHAFVSEGVPDEVLQKAKAALSLSDVQVEAVKTLLKMRSQTMEQISKEVGEAHGKLGEFEQSNANPADIGKAFLAAQSAQKRFRETEDKFKLDFQALLNTDQRNALARINAASEQIEALRHLGVLNDSGPHAFGVRMGFPGHEFEHAFQIERSETGRR